MLNENTYIKEYEYLFRRAYDLFTRLRKDGPEMYLEHLRLSGELLDLFDRHGEGLLDSLFSSILSEILSFPSDSRKKVARSVFNELRERGLIAGAKYQQHDREARKVFKYYAGIQDTLLNMEEVLDWLFHFSRTVAGWWGSPRLYDGNNQGLFSAYYQPKTTKDSILKFLKPDTPDDVRNLLNSRLWGLIKDGNGRYHHRTSAEWEAIAVIVFRSVYFRTTYRDRDTKRIKQMYFHQWFSIFSNLLQLPPFTQRPGNNAVKVKVEELLAGEFNFLPQRRIRIEDL